MHATTKSTEVCPACMGAKIQTKRDGVRILCPACNGRGYILKHTPPIYKTVTWNAPKRDYQLYI